MYGGVELKGYNEIPIDEEDLMPHPRTASNSSRSRLLVGSIVFATVGSLILFSNTKISSRLTTQETFAKTSSSTSSIINYTFKRVDYPPSTYFDNNNDGFMKYAFMESKVGIIEPYNTMEFHLYDNSTSNYEFTLCSELYGCKSGNYTNYVSSSFTIECGPHDTLNVTVTEIDATTSSVLSVQEDVAVCLYVRREVRDMTDTDMARFISTYRRLEYYDDETGRALFGDKFVSPHTLLSTHVFNAAMHSADHFHEGNGFLMQHLKLNAMFESSLQAVNPSVCLPYWDFTIDSVPDVTLEQSFVFSDTMFGKGVRPSDITQGWLYEADNITDAKISSGLWKGALAAKVEGTGLKSFGYGYMRAPWSMNPSPYVSRYTMSFVDDSVRAVNCSDHYSLLQYDDLMDFYFAASASPHLPLHLMTGGVYGCDLLNPLIDSGYITNRNSACEWWVYRLKSLYRYGVLIPNSNCTLADPIEDSNCGFTCVGTPKEFYVYVYDAMSGYLDDTKEDIAEVMYNYICNGGDGGRIFPGDHLEASSAADPSFWVIHTTLERLYTAKMLAGGFNTSAWATDPLNDYVCSSSACYDDLTDSFVTTDCCYGHYENDKMYDGITVDKSTFGHTNRQIQNKTDPTSTNYSANYVYDGFEWSHCVQDFPKLLSDLYLQSLSSDSEKTVARPESQIKTIAEKIDLVAKSNEILLRQQNMMNKKERKTSF